MPRDPEKRRAWLRDYRRRADRLAYDRAYRKTENGLAYDRAYRKTEEHRAWRREYDRAYSKTEKYRAWRREHRRALRKTEKYRASERAYHQTEKYRASERERDKSKREQRRDYLLLALAKGWLNMMETVEVEDVKSLSDDELRVALASAWDHWMGNLRLVAGMVAEFERRKLELPAGFDSMRPFLLKIHHGQLLPEAFASLKGNLLLLEKVASLPIPEQQRVAKDEKMEVVVVNADGSFDKTLLRPSKMRPNYLSQVFAKGHIRNEAEQVQVVRQSMNKPLASAMKLFKLDRRRKAFIVGGQYIVTAEQLRALLKQLEGP